MGNEWLERCPKCGTEWLASKRDRYCPKCGPRESKGSKQVTITIPGSWVGEIRKSLEKQNFKLEKAILDVSIRPKFSESKETFTMRFVYQPKKSVFRARR